VSERIMIVHLTRNRDEAEGSRLIKFAGTDACNTCAQP
jgi:hypothetical protein